MLVKTEIDSLVRAFSQSQLKIAWNEKDYENRVKLIIDMKFIIHEWLTVVIIDKIFFLFDYHQRLLF